MEEQWPGIGSERLWAKGKTGHKAEHQIAGSLLNAQVATAVKEAQL